jgi:hypothetical protein
MDFSSSLFQKISQKIPTETIVRDFLLEYLQNMFSIELDRKQIMVSKNTLEFKVPTVLKTKLKPLHATILENLNEYLKEKRVPVVMKRIM